MSGASIGIDLGTTNSVVAIARDTGVEVIADAKGHRLHSSVVAFKPSGELLVGLAAKLRRVVDPRNTIFSAKRLIGQPFQSPRVQATVIAHLPYKVVEGPDQQPIIVSRGGRHSVVEISTMILSHLREIAEARIGGPVESCVITVPANFTDAQREATRRAGEAAGLRVLRILNEPTAAALAYGIGKAIQQRIAVFDMGGGTFDVTVLAVRDGFFEVLATGGDPFLGGDDMDAQVAEMLRMQFLQTHRVDLREHGDTYALLTIAGEQLKAKLSTETEITGTLKELAYGVDGTPLSLDFRLTRAELEKRIDEIVDRALVTCGTVIAEAGLTPHLVDEVILVGGATRVPLVRRRVAAFFGREPRADLNPMEVVAEGAALQARILTSAPGAIAQAPVLMDVTPHALGVAIAGAYTDVLIEKNEAVPVERTRVLTTARDNQREVVIRVCQGSEKLFTANTLMGELRLDGLRAARRGELKIEVTFLVDADGILQVSATDQTTGRTEHATLRVLGLGERS
jgi:molecular chaperone DnaK